jgi:hypothetical protein
MTSYTSTSFDIALLQPVRQWLDALEVHNPKLARLLFILS